MNYIQCRRCRGGKLGKLFYTTTVFLYVFAFVFVFVFVFVLAIVSSEAGRRCCSGTQGKLLYTPSELIYLQLHSNWPGICTHSHLHQHLVASCNSVSAGTVPLITPCATRDPHPLFAFLLSLALQNQWETCFGEICVFSAA